MRYGTFIMLIIVLLLCASGAPALAQGPDPSPPSVAPSPQPSGTPEPIELTGTGDDVSDPFTLEEGIVIFSLSHDGTSVFTVELLDETGSMVELLVLTTGVYDGSLAAGVKEENLTGLKPGTYVANIAADGNWNIKIEQPQPAAAPQEFPLSFAGTGDGVTPFFSLEAGLTTFAMSHYGSSSFAVKLYTGDGSMVDYLALDMGRYEGKKAIGVQPDNIFGAVPGFYILSITADGDWEITMDRGL